MKQLVEFKKEFAAELFAWFANQTELTQWAGPRLKLTQDLSLLLEQLLQSPNTSQIHSFSLLDQKELLAFGQFYLRSNCAHLCRLVVSPSWRGHSIARELIENLLVTAKSRLSVSEASLFVYPDNLAAIAAYQRIGFSAVDYPGDDAIDGCLYMQRSISTMD